MRDWTPGGLSCAEMLRLQQLWSRRGQWVWPAEVAGMRPCLWCNAPSPSLGHLETALTLCET